jgi:hypothetical protein
MTDAALFAWIDDLAALSLTLYGEARGEPIEGKCAVASVVINRTKNPDRFGDTIRDVCLAPRQFSCWNAGDDANHAKLMAMAERLKTGILGTDADGMALAECQFIATGYLKGILRSRCGDCDHYVTRQLFHSPSRPAWIDTRDASASEEFIGSQVFMKIA